MFSNLILRNSRRSRKENGLFFSSLVISIVAFYMILSISTQDVMLFLQKMESDAVDKLLLLIPAFYGMTLGILFFLIYFACKYQFERRRHEFGVYLMLYYARLKSSTKDYRFEDVNLNDCLGEVLEDYAPLLEEKQFVILNKLQSETVYTDRRGLQFMLGQIVSNAIKYSSDSPMLTISMIHSETADILSVEDNGIGVKKYNLPYIFQKGFTGDSTDSRKKATGMGLYLVKKMADDLNLHLEATSQWGKGFKIVIFFPKLRSNGGK